MKKVVLFIFAILLGLNVHAQRRGSSLNNIPQSNREPTKQEIAKYEREAEERKEEYIANFLTTLEADEFQKQIIKINLNSFLEEKIALLNTKFEHRLDREEAVKNLEDTHFLELQELISKSDMEKIKDLIKGDFNEKEVVKDKKKKRKKKKRKNNDD
ncbi:hypothetical protein [Winogradskyella sediminis]|uniref:LTXXQ motif family protein n=1 Tax=Winogradskyella sediminis TaxID=1382466 RepID=A0A1H1WI29_9FLAO|nr:hypothetical protein [Winogradskyella sediminis]SDS96251.1 hypothetical protein SAMN04489797_2871 [Winogradskyella sediminis]